MRKIVAALLLLNATNTTKIDIEGVDRALLLAKLYKKACLKSSSPKLSVNEVRHYVGSYIKRLHGVAMYIKVPPETESNYLDATVYNEANGHGLAESVVNKIKMKSQKRELRCFGFWCNLKDTTKVLAGMCVGVTICGTAAAMGYFSDTVMDFYTNDATENIFINAEGAGETYPHDENGGRADPVAHVSNVSDEVAIGDPGMDPYNHNAELEAMRESKKTYNAIVQDGFSSSAKEIADFYRIVGDHISAPEVVTAKSKLVAAITQYNADYIDTDIDYKLREALFNSAVDEAISDSNKIDDNVKRFLVDPEVKYADSATRDTGSMRETLDSIIRGANVDSNSVAKESDAFMDAIREKFFDKNSEVIRARTVLATSLSRAI